MINLFIPINAKSSAEACGKLQLCFSRIESKTLKEGWVGIEAHQLALLANITDDQFKNKHICGRCILPEYAQTWHKGKPGRSPCLQVLAGSHEAAAEAEVHTRSDLPLPAVKSWYFNTKGEKMWVYIMKIQVHLQDVLTITAQCLLLYKYHSTPF